MEEGAAHSHPAVADSCLAVVVVAHNLAGEAAARNPAGHSFAEVAAVRRIVEEQVVHNFVEGPVHSLAAVLAEAGTAVEDIHR